MAGSKDTYTVKHKETTKSYGIEIPHGVKSKSQYIKKSHHRDTTSESEIHESPNIGIPKDIYKRNGTSPRPQIIIKGDSTKEE